MGKNRKNKHKRFEAVRKKGGLAKAKAKAMQDPRLVEQTRVERQEGKKFNGQTKKWGLNKNILSGQASEGTTGSRSSATQAPTGGASAKQRGRGTNGGLTKLQAMMKSKMDSAKFRWLNEKLSVPLA